MDHYKYPVTKLTMVAIFKDDTSPVKVHELQSEIARLIALPDQFHPAISCEQFCPGNDKSWTLEFVASAESIALLEENVIPIRDLAIDVGADGLGAHWADSLDTETFFDETNHKYVIFKNEVLMPNTNDIKDMLFLQVTRRLRGKDITRSWRDF